MALEGTLQDMSLTDLFQIFRSGAKSGILVLVGGAERGVIYVNQGRLIDAVLVRGSERQIVATAEEAVLRLLEWEDALFTFRHDLSVTNRPNRITHDGEWLVLESLRRRTHLPTALSYQKITLDSRLDLASLPSSIENGVNLDLDQWRILSQISIYPTVREICESTGMAQEQVIRTVTALVSIGLVDIAPPPRPTPTVRTTTERRVTTASRTPELALVGGNDESNNGTAGRGLLTAIMRRIRGL